MQDNGIVSEAVYVDLGVAAFLLLSGGLAARVGFAKAVLSIIAWVVAAASTALLFPIVAPYALGSEAGPLDDALLGAFLFASLLVVLLLGAHLVGRRFEEDDVGLINRVFGFCFGLLRGSFILAAAYLLASILHPPHAHPEWMKQATVRPLLAEGAAILDWLAPDQVLELRLTLKQARDEAEAAVREQRSREREEARQKELQDR